MEYRLLGPVEVMTDGGPVRLGSAKQRCLLAVLALSAGHAVTAERLVDALWGEDPPADPGGALRFHVHRLRRALTPAGGRVATRPGGYALDVDPGTVDVVQVERLSTEAQQMEPRDPSTAAGLLRAALDRWRGPPLADVATEPFAPPEVARLQELRRSLTERWLSTKLESGAHGMVVAELEGLVEVEPLDERWWALLMLAQYRSGRQADALAAYQQARTVLADELGLDPSPELRRLEVRILEQDRTLDPARPTGTDRPLSAVAVPSNLPVPRTSFVGRERDLAELTSLLEQRPLVTLVGVGGAGKTRLAVELAHRLGEQHSDGAFFVDLSSLADETALVRRVAESLGATGPYADGGDGRDALVGFLAGRRLLIVLDNCEHLLDACAELVDDLLTASSDLRVLATSREALAVDGEQIWQVRSLSLPGSDEDDGRSSEAMQLLVDRIRAARPDFTITEDNRGALVEICVHLDGIPLALELAAARAKHLDLSEIQVRLADRFTLLAGGRRRSQRHQTLQATVDWSYQLLEPSEQALLRQLAVFAGSFELDAVEGICTGDGDAPAVEVLGSLVDKSLVEITATGRYRLLETIRLYAEDKLVQAGEADLSRSRHRDWYLARLEAVPLDRCLLSYEFVLEVSVDADNLRAALAWCHAQGRPDLLRRLLLRVPHRLGWHDRTGTLNEWAREALAHERSLPPDQWHCHVRADAPFPGGGGFDGDFSESEERLERLGRLAQMLPDGEPITAYAHLQHAQLLCVFPQRAPEIDEAAARAIAHAGSDAPRLAAHGRWRRVTARLYQHRYEDAAAQLDAIPAAARFTELDVAFGVVRLLQGRPREALELLHPERALAAHPREDPRWWTRWRETQIAAALALAALGDIDRARHLLCDTVDLTRQHLVLTHPFALSDCLIGFAGIAVLEGDAQRAARLVASIPGMWTSTTQLLALLRHYRDQARDHLDPETRLRCIEAGRATPVDDALDAELAR